MERRFTYRYSNVYGWAVYDNKEGGPAYRACSDMLPAHEDVNGDIVAESPVMLRNEWQALRLAQRLEKASRLYIDEL